MSIVFSASFMAIELNSVSKANAGVLTTTQKSQVKIAKQFKTATDDVATYKNNKTIRSLVKRLGSFDKQYQNDYLDSLGIDTTYILSENGGVRGFDLTEPYYDKEAYQKIKNNLASATIEDVRQALLVHEQNIQNIRP